MYVYIYMYIKDYDRMTFEIRAYETTQLEIWIVHFWRVSLIVIQGRNLDIPQIKQKWWDRISVIIQYSPTKEVYRYASLHMKIIEIVNDLMMFFKTEKTKRKTQTQCTARH